MLKTIIKKQQLSLGVGITLITVVFVVLGLYFFAEGEVELGPDLFQQTQLYEETVFLPAPPLPTLKVVRRINNVMVTAYSSSRRETDNTPFITASGSNVREGIVANNYLPFGTLVRLPEVFGDTVFEVQDRMSWKKNNFHIDIWFPTTEQAMEFGKKLTVLEVVR